MDELKQCAGCNSEDTKIDKKAAYLLGLPHEICILRCKHCGLRWLNPMKSLEEYRELYKFSYFEDLPENYERVANQRLMHYKGRIQKIKKLIKRSNIELLDVGAATGEFVNEAKKAGITATGVEPSSMACLLAKEKYNIEMIQGDILNIEFGKSTCDIIHMNHVLEHIVLPNKLLSKLNQILKKGGYLVIEVPCQFGNIMMQLLNFFHLLEPQHFSMYSIHHPFFYTPQSLRVILEKHGFTIERLRSWLPYLSVKLRFAQEYCKYPPIKFFEKYLRLMHMVLQEKGQFVFTEVYARKI